MTALPPSSPYPPHSSRTPWSVAVTLHVYRLLLGLYPSAFRAGYGADVLQVFRQCCGDAYRERGPAGVVRLWLPAAVDLFVGAVADYYCLVVEAWRRNMATDRVRLSAITVFCAYIAFVLAGMGFQKMSEYEDFSAAAQAHALIGISFNVIVFGSAVALLAVLAGGLPLAFASLRYALSARRFDILLLFSVPVIAFGALIGYGAIALAITRSETHHITPLDVATAIGLVTVLTLGAIASAIGVSLAVKRSQIGDNLLLFTRIPAVITTLAMAAMCVATIVWGLSLRSDVPQLFNGDGGLVATNTAANWLIISVVMTIATLVAVKGVIRGFGISRHTPAAA